MNHQYLLLFFLYLPAHAMQNNTPDDSVVSNASYLVYQGATSIPGGVPTTSRIATFYTFDGRPIKSVEHKFCFPVMDRKLDRNAPKPQPTEYEIKFWPAFQFPLGIRKGAPGNFILFYDKSGNIIDRLRYDDGSSLETFKDKFDLSVVRLKN